MKLNLLVVGLFLISGCKADFSSIPGGSADDSTASTSVSIEPDPTPSPTPTPEPTATPVATTSPTPTPTPVPTASPTPEPTAAPTASPTPAPTPSPTPALGATLIFTDVNSTPPASAYTCTNGDAHCFDSAAYAAAVEQYNECVDDLNFICDVDPGSERCTQNSCTAPTNLKSRIFAQAFMLFDAATICKVGFGVTSTNRPNSIHIYSDNYGHPGVKIASRVSDANPGTSPDGQSSTTVGDFCNGSVTLNSYTQYWVVAEFTAAPTSLTSSVINGLPKYGAPLQSADGISWEQAKFPFGKKFQTWISK